MNHPLKPIIENAWEERTLLQEPETIAAIREVVRLSAMKEVAMC